MSHFVLSEAEEDDSEDEEYNDDERKKLKKMKKAIQDSSEEEEDDEEALRKESKGFIADGSSEEEDDGDGSGSDGEGGKRKRDDDNDDLDTDVDEDDLNLIEENLGTKIDRKKKFKRLKRIEEDDSDAEEEGDGRDRIANEIFDHRGSGDEEEEDRHSSARGPREEGTQQEYGSGEGEDDSEAEDDFIVDDDGKPIKMHKKKAVFDDEGLEAARDIFGCDFDYGEFDQYDEWEEGEGEEDEDEDDEYDEDDEDGPRPPKKKKEKRKQIKKSIYEVFEPSELERGHLTDQDQEIRKIDVPERFQLRLIPVTRTRAEGDDRSTDKELDAESKWIYHHAFYRPFISNQEGRDEARQRSRLDRNMIQKIYNALDLMRNSTCEVPFIAFYRKEEVQPELNIHDLWKVYKMDEKWCQLKGRKENLRSLLQKMLEYQGDLIMKDLDAPLPENVRMLQQEDIDRIDEIQTTEEFNDCYKHFQLYYGKDRAPMQDHFIAKEKAKEPEPKKTRTRIIKVKRMVKRKVQKKKKSKKFNIDSDDDDGDSDSDKDKRKKANIGSDGDSDSDREKKKKANIGSDDDSDSDKEKKKKANIDSDDDGDSDSDKEKKKKSNKGSDDDGDSDSDKEKKKKSNKGSDDGDSDSDKEKKKKSNKGSDDDGDSDSDKEKKKKSNKGSDDDGDSDSDKEKKKKSNKGSDEDGDSDSDKEKEKKKKTNIGSDDGSDAEKKDGEKDKSKKKTILDSDDEDMEQKAASDDEGIAEDHGSDDEGIDMDGEKQNADKDKESEVEGAEKAKKDQIEEMEVDGEKNDGEEGKNKDKENELDKEKEKDNDAENKEKEKDDETENKEKKKNDAEKEKDEETEEEEVETEVETEIEEEIDDELATNADQEERSDELKKAVRRHEYEFLRKAGIEGLTKQFGLTPEQFGENLRDNYQRYDVDQCEELASKEADKYINKICTTPERALEAAVRMVGWQLSSEPLVRKTVREAYFERCRIAVRPTPIGLKMIDEQHPCLSIKYLSDKPATDLQGDQYMRIKTAVEDKHLTITFSDTIEGNTTISYLDEMKQLYYKDEFSNLVKEWNDLRGRAVEFAMKVIINDLKRELSSRLLVEAKDCILEACCTRLYNWLKTAPYNPGDFSDEDEDDWQTSSGFRVFSIAFAPEMDMAAFGACIDIDGDVCEYIRLPHILKRRNGFNERNSLAKEDDIRRMTDFIQRRKPHVIVVNGESRDAIMIMEDLVQICKDLEEQDQFPKINVELMDNDLARLYCQSKRGIADFLDYPDILRQAICNGRRIQDPLIEFSLLCNADEEILNLRFHSLQNLLNQQELMDALYTEFVNRVNEVGVDLNRACAYPYTQNLVQFICGLGPRKANLLIKSMKQNNQRLENRNQLVVNFHMGPKVFINCAGFIKIDTNALGDSDNYIEVLDSTRIHPEAYDWARKMAVDALEYEDEEGKPAEALEEILEEPEKLSELDLEAFATELQNQGFGKKNTTLYDIRHELNHRYKDFRVPYKSPSAEEVFNILTRESPETFYVGKMVQVTVIHFVHRKPRGDQLDNANPVRNEDTGLWQCPFCLKNDFPELSEVWNHFDAGDCPGQAIGIKAKLDNGVIGFVHIKNLSDKTVTNPEERVKRHGLIFCRIMKIDPEKFSVELTCRTSDLQDKDGKWRTQKDAYYDHSLEDKDSNVNKSKLDKKKTTYQKRVIAHAAFKNIDFNEAEKTMVDCEQGEVIIRPSSKGTDHLTVTWKVTDNICQHIDIRETDKQNEFSLGAKLWIGNEEFEDLDEIIARHVNPMSANARQILEYKYYKESYQGSKEKSAEHLKEEKKKNSKTIPYVFTSRKDLPGKFMLSYLPRVKVIHEYVSITQDGFKFRNKIYSSLQHVLKWFKANFRLLSSGMGRNTPGMMSSRTPYMGGTTPSNMMGVDASTIQKVAQNMNPNMLHNLSAAASTTPYGAHTPGGYSQGTPYSVNSYANTPYTPSGQTPFMTPYATPGPSTTPRYGNNTPSHHGSGGGRTPSHRPVPSQLPNRPPPNRPPPDRPQHDRPPPGHNPHVHGHGQPVDWNKEALAWAQNRGAQASNGRDGRNTPRHGEGRTTPRYSDSSQYNNNPGYGEDRSRRTPRYDVNSPRAYHDYDNPRATPRSSRSTPKTIHSPTNMSIGGDQTPLYDE